MRSGTGIDLHPSPSPASSLQEIHPRSSSPGYSLPRRPSRRVRVATGASREGWAAPRREPPEACGPAPPGRVRPDATTSDPPVVSRLQAPGTVPCRTSSEGDPREEERTKREVKMPRGALVERHTTKLRRRSTSAPLPPDGGDTDQRQHPGPQGRGAKRRGRTFARAISPDISARRVDMSDRAGFLAPPAA